MPTSAYIHIPFCRRRCFYCDFPISVVGDRQRGETSEVMETYVNALCKEIEVTPREGKPLQTIFFGGGTPSLLSVKQLEVILSTLQNCFGFAAHPEISMEMDPGTFSLAQLQGFCGAGINRISLGTQAFQDNLLQVCGRSHSVAQIYESIEMIAQVGLANFSLDLISGLPQQTLAQWEMSLDCAIAIHPTHLSTYDLVLEPTTAFGKRYQPGHQPLPTDETAAQMYRLATQRLSAAGYRHYEVSNYARPGFECRHNQVYWRNEAYYGFGMGATSYVNLQRFNRPRTRETYLAWVEDLIAAQGHIDCPIDTQQDRLLETLMLGLRLAEGLRISDLQQQFGIEAVTQIIQCLESYPDWGLVDHNTGTLRLTDPEGFLFSNQVLVSL
ncbi:MAG: radical SAM family heme chaperone HemW, partial [Thermosynechococcaceae cyanobacterium]